MEKKIKDIKLEEDERTDAEEEGYLDGMEDEKDEWMMKKLILKT